jgi:biopolymer transport protein ExbB/TolQ
MDFLGLQKYFILAFAILFLASAGAAVTYRASYQIEQSRRIGAEDSLKQTVASLDEFRKHSAASLEAVNRAASEALAASERRMAQRERVVKSTNEQDGPIAPVLRDAINGVR